MNTKILGADKTDGNSAGSGLMELFLLYRHSPESGLEAGRGWGDCSAKCAVSSV